jgi:nanoRNase/pAp phosphatase (c-di-AMP/oligoRNAs hydrolase)
VVGVLSTWPGDLVAVVSDDATADDLADLGAVDARVGDPADPPVDRADTVYVAAGTDSARVARAARERYPDALLVVQRLSDDDADLAVADRVVDEGRVVGEAVLAAVTGDRADRLRRLRRVFAGAGEPVAVVTHDNPDPDAIGAALALVEVARSMGVEAVPCYAGDISHQENRALVNLLDIDLHRLDGGDLDGFGGVVLVDHSRPGVNDSLDPDTRVDAVVDHHPPREPVSAPFVDIRPEVGATSTLLVDYLEGYGIEPSAATATALLFGIWVDTREFTREASERDFEAAAFLLPHVDGSVLERVESPSFRPDVLDALARAVRTRDVRGSALAAGVGRVGEKDALAQAADFLLGMEGVDVVIVYGMVDGTVHVSGRARGGAVDLGETFRDAFGQVGSAGGHADMAGAQISLGVWADVDEGADDLRAVVDEVVADRFFETLETAPRAPTRSAAAEMTMEVGPRDPDREE